MHKKIEKRICRWVAHHIYLSDSCESYQSHTHLPQWLRCVPPVQTQTPHVAPTPHHDHSLQEEVSLHVHLPGHEQQQQLNRTTTEVIALRLQLPDVTSMNTNKCQVFDFLPLLVTMSKRCHTICTLHSECYVPVPQVLVCLAAWLTG